MEPVANMESNPTLPIVQTRTETLQQMQGLNPQESPSGCNPQSASQDGTNIESRVLNPEAENAGTHFDRESACSKDGITQKGRQFEPISISKAL